MNIVQTKYNSSNKIMKQMIYVKRGGEFLML